MTNRQLRINFKKDQNNFSRLVKSILEELIKIDKNAFLLPMDKAIASRLLTKSLWNFLPGENESYQFTAINGQISKRPVIVPNIDLKQIVTLHLGWDTLSFSCSFEAAWFSWANFHSLDNDTFNCCIYPDNLDWYIIRAGLNLYPMEFTNNKYMMTRLML